MRQRQCSYCAAEGVGPKAIWEFPKGNGGRYLKVCYAHAVLRLSNGGMRISPACVAARRAHDQLKREAKLAQMRERRARVRKDWKERLSRKIAGETGVPFEQVHTVVSFLRSFRFGGKTGTIETALRSWAR